MATKHSPTDNVPSTEFRRMVAALVEEEVNKLQGPREQREDSVLKEFAGEVSVTGLSDAIKAKNKILRGLWLLIFLGGLSAAAFFVYLVFEEYRNEPTATKVNIIREANYSFPKVVLCVDTWANYEKAMALGLTREAVHYSLHYLIPFEDVATEEVEDNENATSLHHQFLHVYKKHNFSSLPDYFKFIALDAVYNSKSKKDIGYSCSGCVKGKQLEKVIIDKSVCYNLFLKPVDGKLRQSYGLPEFEFRVPDLGQGILKRRAYWKLYVNPAGTHLMSDTPYVSIYEKQAHSVRIKSENFRMAPLGRDPCLDKDDPKYADYSTLKCVVGCAWTVYRHVYKCSVLNLDLYHGRSIEEYCNNYYWKQWPRPASIDRKTMRGWMLNCITDCKEECNIWWYSTNVDAHYSNSLVKEAEKWSNESAGFLVRSAKLYFINMDVLAGGVVTFTEVSTYSFQTLIGNIGGTCGIWIGVSVMTLIQLCMFFIEKSLDKAFHIQQPNKKLNGQEKQEQVSLV